MTTRRNFLMGSLAALGSTVLPTVYAANYSQRLGTRAFGGGDLDAGWRDKPRERGVVIRDRNFESISELNDKIRGTGKGKVVGLWDAFQRATGSQYVPHDQGRDDCVSHATGTAIDLLTCAQITMKDSPHVWRGPTVTELIHGGSQREIGDKYGFNMYRGSLCVCAASFVRQYGILTRKRYLNTYDFRAYSYKTAYHFTLNGVPDELELISKIHPLGCAAIVRSWEEVRDAVANGYPVIVGSSQGFKVRGGRNHQGFLLPSRNIWMHGMCIGGVRDDKRPGGCLLNSWGSTWVGGPKAYGQPDGSFWADAAVIDRMVRQGDAFALSCFAGFPKVSYNLW
jgi:hypothetical protein